MRKVFKNRNVLICSVFFVLIAVFISACGNDIELDGYLVDDDRYVLFSVKDNALISDGIYVADTYIITDGGFFDLVTLVLNESGVNLNNIHIEFELYDVYGNIIATKEDNSGKVNNGDSYRSSVPVTLKRDVYSIKITEVSAR